MPPPLAAAAAAAAVAAMQWLSRWPVVSSQSSPPLPLPEYSCQQLNDSEGSACVELPVDRLSNDAVLF